MRHDKQIAIQLRKNGESYREIANTLGMSKSTLASWFKNTAWSQAIKKQLSLKARIEARQRMIVISHRARQKRIKLYREYRISAAKQYNTFKNERLFIFGITLYWGEGDSKLENGIIRITNTDPEMIKLFHIFLKKYFSKIYKKTKAYLILYPDLNDKISKNFWSKKIELPLDKFIKSHYIKGYHPTKRLLHGICTIFISSRRNKETMNTWIKLLKKDVESMRV